jgi:hypothetical protein
MFVITSYHGHISVVSCDIDKDDKIIQTLIYIYIPHDNV